MNSTHVADEQKVDLQNPLMLAGTRAESTVVVTLFTMTLFVSALLLFLVQPMVAKMVLPMLGGAPMVWNTCMVFFQIALLAGYAYAHGSTRWLRPRAQIAVHLGILAIAFAFLPFLIQRNSVAPPEGAPVLWVLTLLATTIGFPFFVLSTTASVLQHWFSRTDHQSAGDPYFLYVASNIGSLVALGAYPALVEPVLPLADQSRVWTIGYGLFVVLVSSSAVVAWRQKAATHPNTARSSVEAAAGTLSVGRRARWVMLAFVPSSLMLAVTTYLSTDIAAFPLLWIVPLGLYLVTFIIAFSSRREAVRGITQRGFPLLLMSLAVLISIRATGLMAVMFPLNVLTFVLAALLCHGALADDRPDASHLTEFYLWISFGGMLGGLFNSLAAPVLFTGVWEYPLVLVLACFMLPGSKPGTSARDLAVTFGIPLGIGVLTTLACRWVSMHDVGVKWLQVAVAVPALLAFSQKRHPIRFGLSVDALVLAGLMFASAAEPIVFAERTFFGVYRVSVNRTGEYRALAHGTTLHGMQAINGPEVGEPLTYFTRGGPFGQAFKALPQPMTAKNIAVIGLGVGTLGAYAQPDQHWTFFEIDPAVERIARDSRYFNYLDRCGERCQVVLGDARLSLARPTSTTYDLLVLDAFSSDSIPVHLLTNEALTLYLTRVRQDGAILFHISNGHLKLAPIVAKLAEQHNLTAYIAYDRREHDWPRSRTESTWVALARTSDDLGGLTSSPRWEPLKASPDTPLWTDDFSNILSALRLR